MSFPLRWALLGLLLVSAVPAENLKTDLTVTPAPAARNLYRWQLLPGLVQRHPGDAVEVYRKATAAYQKVEPDREERGKLTVLLGELQETPLAQLDRKKVAALVKRLQPMLDLVAEGARCEQANWEFVTERLRNSGLGAILNELQEARDFMSPLVLQARLHLLEDRPEKAIEVAATGLSLSRQVGECPTLIAHLVALAIAHISLDIVQEAIQHPKCPGLYGPLTELPRPLVPSHKAYEGERIMCYGTVPKGITLRQDPMLELPAATIEQIARLYRGLRFDGQPATPAGQVGDRFILANAMKEKHPAAVKALKANGYDDATIAKLPILNASLLHSFLQYEEALGKHAIASRLPYPEAEAAFEALAKEYPTGDKAAPHTDEPAFPLARFLLPAGRNVTLGTFRLNRRLEALRTAEALRQYAVTTGKWPEKLADLKDLAPVDPITLKPFEYRVEGDVATLGSPLTRGENPHTYGFPLRLTLRKGDEKKP